MDSYKEVINILSNKADNNHDCPSIKGGPTIYWIRKP
jgi:hypothetical protein